VLFDLGGVLLPFDRERRIAEVVRRLGCEAGAARAVFESDLPARMDLGQAGERDYARAFTALAGRSVDEGETRELILSVFEAPDAPTWALATALAPRFTVGGFSDNPPLVREVFPPGAALEPMIFSAEIGAMKPSEAAFSAAERIVHANGPEILFIDDSAANVEAAGRRGWQAIRYVSAAALRRDLEERGLL
jgi:putative hydrolase of the HAD superfamily